MANHNSHSHVVNTATAQTTKNIFLAISGFSDARLLIFSRYGVSLLTAFVSISSNHHSTTSPFANHHNAANATPTLSLSVDITPLNV
jgi:hypothetical protein